MLPSHAEVDQRLAAVLKNVRAGKLVSDTWEWFSVNYFRGCTDQEAADVLRAWCERHGIEAKLDMEKSIAGNKQIQIIKLTLRSAR